MEYTYGHGDRPLAGYTIMRAVGRGAFGEVYFAVSDGGREVALKRLIDNAEIELRGVKRCINIKNPHLVSIFDIKTGDDGRPYLIMEYVAGPSLRDLLNEHPSGLGEEKTRFFFRGMTSALACLHARSIVHRDLKPENIFLDEGYIKIGDYGLAKHISLSQPGRQTINLGTVHYMAPEIATGVYDHRVDVYALGVILYEMLTGEAPFLGKDMYEIALKHVTAKPETKRLARAFRPIVAKAMAKDPAARYANVQEMAAELGIDAMERAASPIASAPEDPNAAAELPRTGAPPGAEVRHVTIASGAGWPGRIGMTMIAALAMALAISLAPEGVGMSFRSLLRGAGGSAETDGNLWTFVGGEFLPVLIALAAGSLLTGSISLWFTSCTPSYGAAGMACRLLVATVVTVLCGAALFFGPYIGLSGGKTYATVSFGLGRQLPGARFKQLLFILFVGLALINWCKVASPERRVRVSFAQPVLAALGGWVVAMLVGFPGLLPAGFLAGLTLCVNFLAPMREDLIPAAPPPRRRRLYVTKKLHLSERPQHGAPKIETASGSGERRIAELRHADARRRRRINWLWWILGLLALLYVLS